MSDGKRPELVGGGLIRSMGVGSCRQQRERRCRYQAKGYNFDWLVSQIATLPSASQSVKRGEKIVKEKELKVMG